MTRPDPHLGRRILVGVTLVLCLLPAHAIATPQGVEWAERGDVHQAAGEYLEAVRAYQHALTAGLDSTAVHFNLGLVHAHLEQFGLSTYHLTQAHYLAPRATDVRESLALVRAEADRRRAEGAVGDEVVTGTVPAVLWLELFHRLRPHEVQWGIIVLSFLGFGLLMVRRRIAPSGKRDAVAVSAVIILVLLCLAVVYYGGAQVTAASVSPGVVVIESPRIREGPDPYAPRMMDSAISIGSLVRVREQRSGWVEVELSDGQTGWLEQAAIRSIRLGPTP